MPTNFFFLYGTDTFSSIQELRSLISAFKQKTGGEIIELDENNFSVDIFNHHVRTCGLFMLNKMIVVKNILLYKLEPTAFLRILDACPSNTTLVFFEREIDKRSSLFKELVKRSTNKGKCYYPEFKEPSPGELSSWIVNHLKIHGITIETQAMSKLVGTLSDRWSAYYAINKLIAQNQSHINETLIEEVIGLTTDDNIFSLLQSVSEKNIRQSFKLLRVQIENDAEPLYILSMIARQLRVFIKVKSAMIKNIPTRNLPAALKEHPYTIAKTTPIINRFSLKQLMQIFQKLEKTDELLKTTALPPSTLLTRLVFDIIKL